MVKPDLLWIWWAILLLGYALNWGMRPRSLIVLFSLCSSALGNCFCSWPFRCCQKSVVKEFFIFKTYELVCRLAALIPNFWKYFQISNFHAALSLSFNSRSGHHDFHPRHEILDSCHRLCHISSTAVLHLTFWTRFCTYEVDEVAENPHTFMLTHILLQDRFACCELWHKREKRTVAFRSSEVGGHQQKLDSTKSFDSMKGWLKSHELRIRCVRDYLRPLHKVFRQWQMKSFIIIQTLLNFDSPLFLVFC